MTSNVFGRSMLHNNFSVFKNNSSYPLAAKETPMFNIGQAYANGIQKFPKILCSYIFIF